MPVQDDNQPVNNDVLYGLIRNLQSDSTAKFEGLSQQIIDLRMLVVQSSSAYDAHNLPSKVESLSARIIALEITNAAERDLPGKLDDYNKRLKTIENLEAERVGRRKLFDALTVIATLLGAFLTVVQIYQLVKGR
jgi:hypothetical protein